MHCWRISFEEQCVGWVRLVKNIPFESCAPWESV